MSERSDRAEALACAAAGASGPCLESYRMRSTEIAPGFRVRRALPVRAHRLVGPWCFLDEMGPVTVGSTALDVPPHPHIGLQTVTWLIEGELLHRDSLGTAQAIRPGQLNLMTAGRGVAHSEEVVTPAGGSLRGLQLWIAQPESERHGEPAFAHHADLPQLAAGDARATLLVGRVGELASPARVGSPALGADLDADSGGRLALPLDPAFEHALVVVSGALEVDGRRLEPGALHYLGRGRDGIEAPADAGTRLLLVGGAPFEERVLMWWNFVARTPEELAAAREDWEAQRRFGAVPGYPGERVAAPPFVDRFRR
jgi:redox-sensitive bicupin YhaK (pirin superfamily)